MKQLSTDTKNLLVFTAIGFLLVFVLYFLTPLSPFLSGLIPLVTIFTLDFISTLKRKENPSNKESNNKDNNTSNNKE